MGPMATPTGTRPAVCFPEVPGPVFLRAHLPQTPSRCQHGSTRMNAVTLCWKVRRQRGEIGQGEGGKNPRPVGKTLDWESKCCVLAQ